MAKKMGETKYEITGSSYRVHDIPERQRPREEMERLGVEHVSDAVLVAIILRSGVRGTNVVELAHRLLQQHGSLTNLAKATTDELARVKGVGRVKAQVLRAALELGRRLTQESLPQVRAVRTPEDAARELRAMVRTLDKEKFWVLLLDAKNRLRADPVEISEGLLDASLVHPREVFREAIRAASAAVVVAHNHPSGDPTPSAEDIRITKQLVEAGRIVSIRVLDHVILGKTFQGSDRDYLSMREAGILEFDA